jgi:hypothetical protein
MSETLTLAKRLARARAALEATGLFFKLLGRKGVPIPEAEYQFAPPRKWRFDFAWPDQKVALEVDGGIWIKGGGRHTRGSGWLKDTEKLNTAASLGWRLLRTTPSGLHDLETIALIRRTLNPQE